MPGIAAAAMSTAVIMATATLVAPVALHAQSNAQGYIYGSGVPAGATITAISNDTGLTRTTTADSDGAFRIPGLQTGSYKVTLHPATGEDQTISDLTVIIGSGANARFVGKDVIALEKMTVSAGSISPIDTSTVAATTIFSEEVVKDLPVARNTTAVALLAPGTTQGVSAFGNLASFGGSSVGENAYYVNGFDLTNFRNGLGGGSVPFDFYDQFQVYTGGYGAEFGRSTGGVIAATTKRGSNTFKAGANVYYSPDKLRSNSPSVFQKTGAVYTDRSKTFSETANANVWVGGPVVKNRLFYFGMVEARSAKTKASRITTFDRTSDHAPFYAGKLDWNITDNHTLELTAISDKRAIADETLAYNYATGTIGASNGVTTSLRGGKDYILRYTGKLTSDFTISALAGKSIADATDKGAGDAYPYILDARSGSVFQLGLATQGQPSTLKDYRKAYRADAEYSFKLGVPQRLRFGVDREDVTSMSNVQYSGGIYWRYVTTAPGKTLANGAVVPAGVTQYARKRVYSNGGSFETLSNALYIEDNIKLLNDRLLITAGLRDETFDNRNSKGASFVKMKNQWAPRIGASFDPAGDGNSKFFANYGRYHLPVATNTNIRLAGGETYYEDYFALNSVGADGSPTVGSQIGGRNWFSRGDIKPGAEIVDRNLKPMYQDEYIVGYQRALTKNWTVGIRFIYRDVLRFIEDMAVDEALNDYAAKLGIPTSTFEAGGNDYYILSNPGQPVTFDVDLGDGKGLRTVTLSAQSLKFPPATRKYFATEIFFERIFDGKWRLQGSYTNSHSYGNDEGSVLSDNGQTDAGLTQLFDHPGLMDYGSGDLANDKRHKFKLFGSYSINKLIEAGANIRIESGTPLNAFGFHPTDAFARQYGASSFYNNGLPAPRGSAGRTPWLQQLDLSIRVKPHWGRNKIVMGIDVFNVLNANKPTEYNQTAETGLKVANPAYLLPTVFQSGRSVRFSMSYSY